LQLEKKKNVLHTSFGKVGGHLSYVLVPSLSNYWRII